MRSIVLYPSPGMGHLISMVELGKFILDHRPTCNIIVLSTRPPFNTGATASYISRISSTIPSITFYQLPEIALPLELEEYPSQEAVTFELLRLSNRHIHHALQSLAGTKTIAAFVVDLFCGFALTISENLGIPTYLFFTSCAGNLAIFMYFPTLHRKTTKSFKDLNMLLDVPGLPPVPSSDMPDPVLERNSVEYDAFLQLSDSLPKFSGVIVNTFEFLESRALSAILEGRCLPDQPVLPVFCLGPLIALDDQRDRSHECLKWLDFQPSQSVVFLCFGSLGLFSAEQLKATAVGLERSGQRFLWVVRSPPSEDKSKRFLPPPDPDLDSLLPDGFLDRTKDKGLIVKSWAPQVAVLNHGSVGGFVTHCGWNSVLEAVSAGVPMVAWPLYAEQRFNRLLLVEEMKLALPMRELDDGFVTAEEVENRVRILMESDEGRKLRERILSTRDEARAAMTGNGSSCLALNNLVQSWNLG